MTPCPDFDLAPLTKFPRDVFSEARNASDGLVLVLALAYNDLKDVMWVMQQLHKCRPVEAVSPEYGQWMGMRLSTTRQIIRILHALLEAIEEARERRVLDEPIVVRAVGLLGAKSGDAWKSLVGLSRGKTRSRVAHYIMRVRHGMSSHFDWKVLADGYTAAFHTPEARGEHNEHAFASLGRTVPSTRFYFADAAAQAASDNIAEKQDLMRELDAYINAMLRALLNLVEVYLKLREQQITTRA